MTARPPTGVAAALAVAALLALALGLAGARAAAADPALEALREADAYASPRALGLLAPEAQGALAEAAAGLAEEGRPAKIAVVAGPAGAPSMRAYALGLRRQLDFAGTLTVTAPGRPGAVAIGPLAPSEITRRLRAGAVGAIPDPVERAVAAARLAAPAERPPTPSGLRQTSLLIGLALLGAAWAVAWGLRREGRVERAALAEARAAARACADAIGARAAALAHRAGAAPAARAGAERAGAGVTGARAAVESARVLPDANRALLALRDALLELERAEASAGEERPAGDPFAGLCGIDPAHGPATGDAVLDEDRAPVPACDACRAAAEAGAPPARRLLPVAGHGVPVAEAGIRLTAPDQAEAPEPGVRR